MMKRPYRYIFPLLALLSLISCSEAITLDTGRSKTTYLVVEGILTDMKDTYQVIKLSQSVKYFTGNRVVTNPPVSAAKVSVFDGSKSVDFVEYPGMDPGSYYSPQGYYAEPGRTYTLHIELPNGKTYKATSKMIESGCILEAVDYKNTSSAVDSSITVGLWARDMPERSNYLVVNALNGNMRPLNYSFGLDDKYYNGQYVQGFPVNILTQTWARYNAGELYAKPFEEGDELTLYMYTLNDEFYEFYWQIFYSEQTMSIPLIASQPANMATNIEGENAVGFFTTAPVQIATCIVDDPARTEFKYESKNYDDVQ